MNGVLIRDILNIITYELYFWRKPNIPNFYIFGYKYFVHNIGKDNLDKFDSKSDKALFIGYSSSSKDFCIFNKRTLKIEESIHIVFDEFSPSDDRLKENEDQEDWLTLINH